MSTELHQRLADLASDAPTPAVGGAAELWAAGKRRQRRRTAAGAGGVVACLLVVMGAVGMLRPAHHEVLPVDDPDAKGALPTRLYVPSRWTKSNEDDPVGPFAVVSSASHGWSNKTGFFGVSATTGEYRFVDLPGLTDDSHGLPSDVVLSPSGRYLAYWVASERAADWDEEHGQIPSSGVAVYDTTTGEAEQREIESPHGLIPWTLEWIDDERLYLQASAVLGAAGSEEASGSRVEGPGWTWRVAGSTGPLPVAVPEAADFLNGVLGTDERGHLLVDARGRGSKHLLLDPDRPTDVREVDLPSDDLGGTLGAYRVSSEGRIAGAAHSEAGNRLVVTAIDGTSRTFSDVQAWSVAGWADATHVVAGVTVGDHADRETFIAKVDVTTGDSERLVTMPQKHLNPPLFASELLGVPAVERPEPERPVDRYAVLGTALAAFAAFFWLLRWRTRRRRARG